MRVSRAVFPVLTLSLWLGRAPLAGAQAPPAPPQDPLITLMASQPSIDTTSPVVATASFDPPAVRPDEPSTYHVAFNALDAAVEWPGEFVTPAGLEMRLTARGQMVYPDGTNLHPRMAINYRVRPPAAGSYTVPAFHVNVNGQAVTVPEARLEVGAGTSAPRPQLLVAPVETNVFPGQPMKVRVLLLAAAGNTAEAMQQVQLNGEGFLEDRSAVRQAIEPVPRGGGNVPAYVYETTVIPLASGPLSLSVQGFTSGRNFSGPIVIQGQVTIPGGGPQYVFVDSDPVTVNVRPLPSDGELPGFTGAIGHLVCDPPRLTTNTVRVGDTIKLTVVVRSATSLARLSAPPPPRVRDWQVFAATDESAPPAQPGQLAQARAFAYTLVPLTDETHATPAIPFSCFDPALARYVDLTIPPAAVTVKPGAAPADARALLETEDAAAADKPLRFMGLAPSPGRVVRSRVPLQWHPWFWLVQLSPVAAFAGLWSADRRRRHLEQHPDLLRRRRARRALIRERRALRLAARDGDATRFSACAVRALRAACAPHFPAEPRALVCADVMQLLDGADSSSGCRDLVRRFFDVTDASRFGAASADATSLLALQSELECLLERLEAKL